MRINLVSSLTADDESRLAPQMLSAIERVLDQLPIAYCVRIETSSGNEIQRSHTAPPQKNQHPQLGAGPLIVFTAADLPTA